jgi:ferredoxin, 2Fe-2S
MPIMTIKPQDKTADVATGNTVLQGLIAAGINLATKCGGKAQCGLCHIFVHEGRKGLSKIQRTENEKLDSIVGVGAKSRLACQTVIGTEDFTVELLGFSSGM